jgi:hypothetical protein
LQARSAHERHRNSTRNGVVNLRRHIRPREINKHVVASIGACGPSH